ALDIVPKLDGRFDLVFNDIDKAHYVDVLPHCIAKLRSGGLLVTDNVLWSGRVAKARRTKETEVIHEYNKRLAADARFVSVIAPPALSPPLVGTGRDVAMQPSMVPIDGPRAGPGPGVTPPSASVQEAQGVTTGPGMYPNNPGETGPVLPGNGIINPGLSPVPIP